jgi:hypothetical protein
VSVVARSIHGISTFLLKKRNTKGGKITDEKLKSKWVNVPLEKLKKLKDLTMQFAWEVMPYVFI